VVCTNCGAAVNLDTQNFCTTCGEKLKSFHQDGADMKNSQEAFSSSFGTNGEMGGGFSDQVRGTISQAAQKINSMVGEEGTIDLNLRDVFSAVLKKHTQEEAEILFTSGTKLTTPSEQEISTAWPKPWLFARVLGVLAIAYIFLFICTYVLQSTNTIPGLIMIGSFAVPFSLLIFFWETNAPMNISIYEISKMFFTGGTASLVITLLLYSFFPIDGLSVVGAVFVGIIEEVGKLVIIAYFIKRLNPKYILNGLLIGAAIGAGFAAFESAGYAFNLGVSYGNEAMLSTIVNRAWTSIGTHTVWAAISGAALVYVKGIQPLKKEHVFNRKFIRLFLVAVALHAMWDIPLQVMHNLRLILLIIVAWIFIFTFINAGLKQIMRFNQGETVTSPLSPKTTLIDLDATNQDHSLGQ
jgi:RsiW-degrading membrane proteinase PrsW (M82 family)